MSNKPVIVVGGSAYADIDVLACVSAYKQLLQEQGFRADGVITGPWNQTIPQSIKSWKIEVNNTFTYGNEINCSYVLVDFSDPAYVDNFVNLNEVIEVFDHHYGYETYWKEKIGEKAKIEKIGACATLIWEEFKKAKIDTKISPVNANLLYTAIFANTLNFKSKVTSERDLIAAKELYYYTKLPSNWQEIYYSEIEEGFIKYPFKNIKEDTKFINLSDIQFNFGQIELFDANSFIEKTIHNLVDINSEIDDVNKKKSWIINIVSIKEGCSYLYSNCHILLNKLKIFISASSEKTCKGGKILATQNLWLRKEILKELMILDHQNLIVN